MPSKLYFWKIFSIIRPASFQHLITSAIQNAQRNNFLPKKITLTTEINQIFNSIDNSTFLIYARKLKSRKKNIRQKFSNFFEKSLKKYQKEQNETRQNFNGN